MRNTSSSGDVVTLYNINIPVTQSGYLYVYWSCKSRAQPLDNESSLSVWFDNLQVTHTHGPLVEENCYYPFGLAMAGLSSKALSFGGAENKVKFTSQLFDNELEWNTYQMKWRTMDPQIGRFLQVDPLAPEYVHNSTYAYAENDVIRAIDLEGLEKYIAINNKTKFKYWNYIERTVTTIVDGKGNLKNQELRDSEKKELLTQKDTYEANNTGKDDGGRDADKIDKFIAKNGIVKTNNEEGAKTELTKNEDGVDVKYAETRETSNGEKIVTAKGLYRESDIVRIAHFSSVQGIVHEEFKSILNKVASVYSADKKDVNVTMYITINKNQLDWFEKVKTAVEKVFNFKLEIKTSEKMQNGNAHFQIVATK